jgi:hypothetical protein
MLVFSDSEVTHPKIDERRRVVGNHWDQALVVDLLKNILRKVSLFLTEKGMRILELKFKSFSSDLVKLVNWIGKV